MQNNTITLMANSTLRPKENALKTLYKLLLTLSFTAVTTHAATKTIKYTVKRGDSLYKIADKNNSTIAKIQKANAMKKNAVLPLGKIIKVPINSSSSSNKKRSLSKKLLASLSNSDKCRKLTSVAKTKLGKRYIWGASGRKNTYDCSSFTKYVYRKNGINIPRTSINQSKYGKYVKRRDLKKGDLIFFDTSKKRKGYVNHVGIYLGNNKFIHASSAKKKVIITSLNKKFYSQRYKGARRPL